MCTTLVDSKDGGLGDSTSLFIEYTRAFCIFSSNFQNNLEWSRKDGSTVKSTDCFCREHGFGSQHPLVGTQPPLSQVPEDLISSSDLYRSQAWTWCTEIHAGETIILINIK